MHFSKKVLLNVKRNITKWNEPLCCAENAVQNKSDNKLKLNDKLSISKNKKTKIIIIQS